MPSSRARPEAADSRRRMAYLVLGMHRSGTSAVTQVLALAGAGLPRNLMGGDQHNARGYFEPWRIALFNDQRLRAAGSAWDDVFALPFRPLEAREERGWLSRAAALFADEYGDETWPLLKDPRVTVLAPFWRTVLDGLQLGARCVIPVRHPLAVAGSLARRDGFTPQKSVLLWTTYMLAAEIHTRDLPRAFVGYDGLLADWRREVSRIEVAHGAALPRLDAGAADAIGAFLAPELRHNAAGGELEALGWTGALAARALAWFEAAARDEAPPPQALDDLAQALAARAQDMAPLVSPLTRDLDALRAELDDLRRQRAHEQRQARRLTAELEGLRRACAAATARLDAALADD